jgi:hypothetical protein
MLLQYLNCRPKYVETLKPNHDGAHFHFIVINMLINQRGFFFLKVV